jgi:hypothetical protein
MAYGSPSRKPSPSSQKLIVAQSDLRRVERACQRVIEARHELEAAIKTAAASGETNRDIAERAGMSHQRVNQILRKTRPTT